MGTAARTVQSPPEQRVILHNVAWETYERLLADHRDRRVPHFNYDRGVLEIVSPSSEHETTISALRQMVEVVAEERNIDIIDIGSMTFRRRDLERGFEPDAGFYIENVRRFQSRTELDPAVDPPPDLVIEIDLTSVSLNKLPLHARMGVPEVWRYRAQQATIYRLEGDDYRESAASVALTQFVAASRTVTRPAWLRTLRTWVREHHQPADSAR